MMVPSFQFLVFAFIGAGFYNLASWSAWRQVVLLIVNIIFFASFSTDPVAFLPFVGFLAFGFVSVCLLQANHVRVWFTIIAVVTLFSFFWLKKYTFIPQSMFLNFSYLTIGLSYVFFRVMHLIIDAYQNALGSTVRLLDYTNYTLNFTSLVSGPIQRYQDYHRVQYESPPALNEFVVAEALERIVLGFFKVFIISSLLLVNSDNSFIERVGNTALIAVNYPIYLFFNFSGYIDVVIGVARLFRNELPENFNHPFSSENCIEFWGRWHITLSTWLKTYVYNQLLMFLMRRFESPRFEPFFAVFAFFVTFFLVGAWHGQTSEFMFFGVLTGGGVAANKLYQIQLGKIIGRKKYRTVCENMFYRSLSRGVTFSWFAFTLLWFWSDWHEIGVLAKRLGAAGIAAASILLIVGAAIVLSVGVSMRIRFERSTLLTSRYLRTALVTAAIVALLTLNFVLGSPPPEIVYKGF
jgi:alginate O-acetyltransferase complex protein AlgI